MEEDIPLIESGESWKIRAKAYDIVLIGNEIGGGSVRIHQNDIQEKMFEMLGFTKDAAYKQFGFLLNAFKYGVPPHAGLAYGLDRLVMLMAKLTVFVMSLHSRSKRCLLSDDRITECGKRTAA